MTTTKVVIRLLDASGALLGWEQHQAAVRGDGCLRAQSVVTIPIERDGAAAIVSVHWADLNVEIRMAVSIAVKDRATLAVFQAEDVIMLVGQMPKGLPAVTLRAPVSVPLLAGGMGASGMRF